SVKAGVKRPVGVEPGQREAEFTRRILAVTADDDLTVRPQADRLADVGARRRQVEAKQAAAAEAAVEGSAGRETNDSELRYGAERVADQHDRAVALDGDGIGDVQGVSRERSLRPTAGAEGGIEGAVGQEACRSDFVVQARCVSRAGENDAAVRGQGDGLRSAGQAPGRSNMNE